MKKRAVCDMPRFLRFAPLGSAQKANGAVIMTVDEYESFRLINNEGLTQQETCERMEVSRTTVQAIHDRASRKIADCLVNGRELIIEGGDYHVCGGKRMCHPKGQCPYKEKPGNKMKTESKQKGGRIMKIAIPIQEDGKKVSAVLGRAPQFALVEGDEIQYIKNEGADSQGSSGIKSAQQLVDLNVEAVLTPRCGVNAAEMLAAASIALFRTEGDSLEDNIASYRAGALNRLTDAISGSGDRIVK